MEGGVDARHNMFAVIDVGQLCSPCIPASALATSLNQLYVNG